MLSFTLPTAPRLKGLMTEIKNGNGLHDVSRTGLPAPMLLSVVAMIVAGLAAFYGLTAKQAQLETALAYEREKDELRVQLTKEQIENAGLRNSALMLSQDLARCNAPIIRGR